MANFQKLRVGEVRAGQVLHTFGIGSVVDLPNMSVVIRGIDNWASAEWNPTSNVNAIAEERLLKMVRNHLGPQVKQLVRPPVPEGGADATRDIFESKGVPVSPFPRWLRCPRCELLAPVDNQRFVLKTSSRRVDETRYVHANCSVRTKGGGKRNWGNPTALPARFVVVCENGHLHDFPWNEYVQHKPNCESKILRLQERGVSSEVADLWVRCDGCKASRQMIHAFGKSAENEPSLASCGGRHPHLGADYESKCDAPLRTMLVGSSNIWFPLTLSSLWIPPENVGRLGILVEENWNVLKEAVSPEVLTAYRNIGVISALDGFPDDQVLEAVRTKRDNSEASDEGEERNKASELKLDEWKVFSNPNPELNSKDFRLREVSPPTGYEKLIDKVVLVDRLRVVQAITGFTRIDSPGDFSDIGEIPDVQRSPLSRALPTWVPASEVRGEGIFIQFKEDVLTDWLEDELVEKLAAKLRTSHTSFRRKRSIIPHDDEFDVARFGLIHTFAHALIRQISIDCGYASASIKERIYSLRSDHDDGPMAGVLLYTAAADSEGTLGGLVALGEPDILGSHIDQALERTRLCASDPLCSENQPDPDGLTLHGAACHACLFISETSCERGNKYLDRSFIVETMSNPAKPFFESTR